ncbi:hypothetical protein Q5752_002130 [Cryptotrichosporon argae]
MPLARDGTAEASSSRPPALLAAPPAASASASSAAARLRAAAQHPSIPPQLHSMFAGAGAGLVSSIVTCPLDVVKTTLQAQHTARGADGYEGVRLTVARIWRQSGFRGFYRGLGPTIGGYLPTWGIYFTVYDLVKDRLGTWAKDGAHPDADVLVVHMVAAMTAGATGTIMTNPLWVVKTRFMAQAVLPPSAPRYSTTFDAVRTIYRTEGFRTFYKGLLPSLLGISHVAVQFPLYEKAKAWASGDDTQALTPTSILLCSAFSKMVASLATYPHEVLRTRLQIQKRKTTPAPTAAAATAAVPRPSSHPLYSPLVTGSNPPVPENTADPYRQGATNGNGNGGNGSAEPTGSRAQRAPQASTGTQGPAKPRRFRKGGIVDTALKIKRQDGWSGFYRGLSINLVRTVPSSAVTMLTYELLMRNLS